MPEVTLLDLSLAALRDHLKAMGEPGYRAEQIWQAVFRDLAISYEQMTTLPQALRGHLRRTLPFHTWEAETTQTSNDRRTTKALLRLHDAEAIETVLMRYDRRRTVCVSSQVGCAMGCQICATGQGGFQRDLTISEIVGQILHATRTFHEESTRLSNVVFMGMGEPFANYDAVLESIRILNDSRGLGLGARSFTVSTVGIVPGIERFASEPLQANLAVSLHTADDRLRDELLPINRTYSLDALRAACANYVDRTHRRITFEVALIRGVNDTPSHAHDVAAFVSGLRGHVNVIPFNPVPGTAWQPSEEGQVRDYVRILEEAGVAATVRLRRGLEIDAGCGQLRAARGRRDVRGDEREAR